jgi:hypothetical protein
VRISIAATAIAILVVGVTVAVQAAVRETPASQTPGTPPTFRSGITLVSTAVIARDGSGRCVADLTKENFTVL